MQELLDRLKAHWVAQGVPIRPGVSPEVLDAFEAKSKVVLTAEVRAYFLAVDGTGEEDDGDLFRFWSFDEFVAIRNYEGIEPEDARWADDYFFFADYSIESLYFAVKLTADPKNLGPVALRFGRPLYEGFPTFGYFLELYLADKEQVLNEGTEIPG